MIYTDSASVYKGGVAVNCILLGTGRQARRLIDAISAANCKIVAVYSRNKERGQRFSEANGLSKDVLVFDNLDQALSLKTIEAAVITTPDFLHYQQAKKALESNKHVFLEKPIATNYRHGQELMRLSEAKNRILAIDYHQRWSLALRYLKSLCEEGWFGNIHHVKISWGWKPSQTDDWRVSENPWWVLSLLGTHCIDHVLWIFKPIFGSVDHCHGVKGRSVYRQQNEDSAKLQFRFANGVVVEVECTLAEESPLTIQIESEKGRFVFDKLVGQRQEIELPGLHKKFEYQNPWVESFKNFKEAVNGEHTFEVSPETALENIRYLLSIGCVTEAGSAE